MDGAFNVIQNVHATGLQMAIKAEQRNLHGLQYFDAAQELEILIQFVVLRPLHRWIIEDLNQHGRGWVTNWKPQKS